MYLQRISSAGMANNKLWYSKTWNHGAGTANGLPNCCAFALGEAYEETEVSAPFSMFTSPYQNAGAFPEANEWYSRWTLKKGVEPAVGGIAVWGGTSSQPHGHVAVVLETKDVGTAGAWMKVAQSNFKGKYFEVKEYTVKKGQITAGVGCPYIGCCYLGIRDMRVKRDTSKVQVDVLANILNVRNKPNGTIYAGRKCPNGLYNILDTKKDGDYTWAKLDEGYWIALNDADGWTKTYGIDFLNFETLKNAYEKLSQKYTDLVLRYERETGKKV